MEISSIGSGMDQVTRSTQVMSDLLKMAVSANQEQGNKLVKMSAESMVAEGDVGAQVDVEA